MTIIGSVRTVRSVVVGVSVTGPADGGERPVRFDERWIVDTQLAFTTRLAAQVHELAGEVVEIGAHQGRLTVFLANTIYPATLHVVDNWSGVTLPAEVRARDNHAVFEGNVREATRGNVKVWKMGWRDWAVRWDKPVRFAHIDAEHSAAEVADCIGALLPLVVPFGVLAGDDYHMAGVKEGVGKALGRVSWGDSLWWWANLNRE